MSKLIMIGGLPGSGKSYLAKALSNKVNAVHINSDVVRKEMNNLGKYETTDKNLVYNQMKQRLISILDRGSNVIVDTTFYKKSLRTEIVEIAKDRKCKPYFILVTADDEIIKKRVSVKRKDSEANFEVYKKLKKQFEPINIDYLEIDTSKEGLMSSIEKIVNYCEF